ncbi:PREDICTED: exostosin-1b-like [Priapulus caudatus]|uniref:Exostosin-1b-like n=1 Tax=Priapulus caudatus TaxID=37621 RepID=A0ABM1DU02_PRICU|nr:PREDICTED: exostosin-1b-like [Priapulus caudatus]
MQAKKRYLLVFISCAFLLLCYFGGFVLRKHGDLLSKFTFSPRLQPFCDTEDFRYDEDMHVSPRQRRDERSAVYRNEKCRMETCFDFSKCRGDFKIYTYPTEDKVSGSYRKVLNTIHRSRYHTTNPAEACIFVLGVDTLDRDVLSPEYIKNVKTIVYANKLWNNGINHVIFNLYSGTFPDYIEDLGFDKGLAILAKASISEANFRPGFDIGVPLFPKNHPEKGGERGYLTTNHFPSAKKYLLVFKGKRYLYGIGSDTRNSLYHLHNGRDIILLTTCKHGKNWKQAKDKRCDVDQAEFENAVDIYHASWMHIVRALDEITIQNEFSNCMKSS